MGTMIPNPNSGEGQPGEGNPPAAPSGNQPANGGQPNNQPANAGAAGGEGGGQPNGGGEGGEGHMIPYGRFKEVNDELATLKAKLSAQTLKNSENGNQPNAGNQPSKPAGNQPAGNGQGSQPTPDEITGKIETLKPVLKEAGFITREDQEADARVAEAKDLMQTHNGSDGLPAFDIDKITEFMKSAKFYGSYVEAYKMLHHEAIVAKAVKDALDGNIGQQTLKGGGGFGAAPKKDAVSREGIAKMPLDQYKKMGGAKALRPAILAGQIQ